MIRQDWMEIVAGEELIAAMEAEQKATVPHTGYGYSSSHLCELQRKQSSRGIVGCEVIKSNHGCSVRYDSGLQDFGLLASSRSGTLDGSYENACAWAIKWVARDPDKRYAWSRK